MMPSFASGLGFGMANSLILIHFSDLCICPHTVTISYNEVMPANFRLIPDMVKNPLPSMEILQTYRTEQVVTKVIFPNRFYLVDFERMHCKLLLGWSRKRATINTTCKGGWLLGRAVGCGRGAIAVSKSTFRIFFNLSSKVFAIVPNLPAPILETAVQSCRERLCSRKPSEILLHCLWPTNGQVGHIVAQRGKHHRCFA